MWQRCPICDGTGTKIVSMVSSNSLPLCDVCNGMKIISTVNGLPPVGTPQTVISAISRELTGQELKSLK